MRPKPTSLDRQAAVVRRIASRGGRIRWAAAELGLSACFVRRIWLELGFPIPPPGPPRSDSSEIERQLREGWSVTTVAAWHGVSPAAISRLASRHGFPIRAMRTGARLAAEHRP